MTDSAFLFHVLEDGKWHSQNEILDRSQKERGFGLTVHSRAADLRKRGCVVECELRRTGNGRTVSYYKLVALDEPTASDRDAAVVGSSSAPETDGAEQTGSVSLLSAGPAGALPLFECEIDESAGMRGAYGNEAA